MRLQRDHNSLSYFDEFQPTMWRPNQHRSSLTKICLQLALATTGTFPNNLQQYHRIVAVLYVFAVLPFVLVWEIREFLQSEIAQEKLYLLMLMTEEIVASTLVYSAYLRRNLIQETYKITFDNKYADHGYIAACDQWTKRDMTKFTFFIWLVFTFTGCPIIFALFLETELGSSLTLICPSAYPWPMNTPGWYLLSLGVQVATIVPMVLTFVGNYAVILLFRITTNVHHRKLLEKIDGLSQRVRTDTVSIAAEAEMSALRDIFMHHQFLKV